MLILVILEKDSSEKCTQTTLPNCVCKCINIILKISCFDFKNIMEDVYLKEESM